MGKLPAWLKVLIVCAAAFLTMLLAAIGFDALAAYMFKVWGITDYSDIILAPRWIRIISDYYRYIKFIVLPLALIPLAALLGKAFHVPKAKWGWGSFLGLALGILTAALLLAALFVTGAVRLNISSPAFTLATVISFALYAAQAFWFARMFAWLIPSLLPRAKYRPDIWIPAVIYAILSMILDSPLQAVNYALVTAICACLYNIWGLGASCLFKLGFDTVLFVIMGAYGGSGGIFETYPAAHDWLSGEYAGPMAGLMLTAVLAVVLIILFRVDAGGNNGRLIADKRN